VFVSCQYDELVTPLEVKAEIKISKFAEKLVEHSRQAIADVISGKDDRVIVVVGPCSIHS
jgi:3-deoxy-7-phosphoheptulonate synthase